MVCKNCLKPISDEGISFCPHCGYYLREANVKNIDNTIKIIHVKKEKSNKKKRGKTNKTDIFVYLLILLLWLGALVMLLKATDQKYYFDENNTSSTDSDKTDDNKDDTLTPGNYINNDSTTSIKYDNKYLKKYSIGNINDVYSLIKNDSISQKASCPQEIINIENEIINNYEIVAVNLCEMDIDFAKEIRNVVNFVYNNYPTARGHLTNITLANVNESYMAAFMPIFTFVTNNNATEFPMGIKSMIVLNSKYFLNTSKINNSVRYGVSSGYFPLNATRSSTVAHEFGHYLSFVAMLNYYNSDGITFVSSNDSNTFYNIYDDFNLGNFSYRIITEAYNIYKVSYGNDLSLDQFRSSISGYAVAKNSEDRYIYDETIAEAFHDYYLNTDNAKVASKLIMNVLKGYL